MRSISGRARIPLAIVPKERLPKNNAHANCERDLEPDDERATLWNASSGKRYATKKLALKCPRDILLLHPREADQDEPGRCGDDEFLIVIRFGQISSSEQQCEAKQTHQR